MSKGPVAINISEWLRELDRCESPPGDSFTKFDVMESIGLCRRAAEERISLWCATGLVEKTGRYKHADSTGAGRPRAYYRFTKKGLDRIAKKKWTSASPLVAADGNDVQS